MKSVLTAFAFIVSFGCPIYGQLLGIQNGTPNPSCGNASGTLILTNCSGCTVTRWQEGTFNAQSQQFTVVNQYSGSSMWSYNIQAPKVVAFRAGYTPSGGGQELFSQALEITAGAKPTIGTLSTSTTNFLNSGSGQLVLSSASGAPTWYKEYSNEPLNLTNGNFSVIETTTFYATVSNATCSGSQAAKSNTVTVNVYNTGTLHLDKNGALPLDQTATVTEGDKVKLMLVNKGGTLLAWEYSLNNGASWTQFDYYSYFYETPPVTGDRFADSHEIWQDTKFRARIDLGPFGPTYTNILTVVHVPFTQANANPANGGNYIKEQQVTVSGVTSPDAVSTLTSSQKREVTNYLDGLGRVQQTNIRQGGALPSHTDVITVNAFDAKGRNATKYLPYVTSQTNGTYRGNAMAEQLSFYANGTADKIADSSHPFAKTNFEKSPLGRVTEQGSVGQEWQPGGGHSTTVTYSNNIIDEIRLIKPDGTSTGFYLPNELFKVETTDPDGKKTQQFVDKSGLTIVSRVQMDATIEGSFVPWLETYNIYNENGSLKYTISPKGVEALKAGNWLMSASIKEQFVNQFVYDGLGRLIEKKVPGQAWSYFCYDRVGRLVLTQDGYLRAQNKWAFIKYDRKNRPVMQGLYTNNSNTTRAGIQSNIIDPLYGLDTQKYYEERGTTGHGYTNQSFPTTGAEVLTVNYYDTYDFDFNGLDDYSYVPQGLAGENAPGTSVGLPTGSKRLVLGTSIWLYDYVFYDAYGRVIQSRTNNHLSATSDNLNTAVFDFEGKLLVTKTYHNAGAGKVTNVINKFSYDRMGRLTQVYQNTNGAATDQLIVEYQYNGLGQLVDKKLHNTGGTAFLQSIDYRYSIQGWLTSINNAQLNVASATNDESNDYFGIEFLYEKPETGLLLASEVNYNGNVSAIKWKGVGAVAGNPDRQAYKFEHDKSNRLGTASSLMYGTSSWNKETGVHTEIMTYDVNGNILSLKRYQRLHSFTISNRKPVVSFGAEQTDDLTYTYNNSTGDRLLKVTDASGKPAGFDNGASGTADDFTYDVNGNLLRDQNKGITSDIQYNHLGKPTQISFSDGRKLEYAYDANGQKLTMKSYATGGTLQSVTEYANGFVYENGGLDFFGSREGRVANAESSANRIANAACQITSGYPAHQAVTVSSHTANGNNYVKAVTNQSTSTPGVFPIEGNIPVAAGETYIFRVRGYASSSNCFLYVSTNLGDHVWPGAPLPVGAANESSVNVRFVVPSGATYVRVGVLWATPTSGQEMYLNHVELRKLDLEYQYSITDHKGNTRVLFSSVTPAPDAPKATFEANAVDGSAEYTFDPATVVTFVSANHTTGGSKVVRMTQNNKVGPARSLKVAPGDKVDMEVWTYFENTTGWGTTSSALNTFVTSIAGAFGGVSGGTGESGSVFNAVNTAYGSIGLAGNRGDNLPSAYLNYMLFDQNYKLMDMGWQPVPSTANMSQQKITIPTVNVKEAGYIFVYLSYEGLSTNPVYFDDFMVTHTKTNVIQYNEYYPFGLSTARSWTRENSRNNYLYNSASERNATTGWYETPFRSYDPVLGRFTGVDPAAAKYSSLSPYNYVFNNPLLFSDPTGADPITDWVMNNSGPPTPTYNMTNEEWAAYSRPGGGPPYAAQMDAFNAENRAIMENVRRNVAAADMGMTREQYEAYLQADKTPLTITITETWTQYGVYDVEILIAPAQQGTRVLIIGGADLFLTGLSEEALGILEGVEGSVHKSAVNYPYFVDSDSRFVDDMASSLYDSHKAGQRIIIYGYSKGGDLALQLSRKLNSMNVPVAALITVDVANGPWSDRIDRTVSPNVGVNYNFYQTTPGSLPNPPSYGGPNTGSGLIFNYDMTGPTINHSNIDLETMKTAIYLINSNIN